MIVERAARKHGFKQRPRWPMIILRSPKGWTGPKFVDGKRAEGTFRAHHVPLAEIATKPEHLAALEQWMRSYRPQQLFDANGTLIPEPRRARTEGRAPDGRQPPYERGLLLRDLQMPNFRNYCLAAGRGRSRIHARGGSIHP